MGSTELVCLDIPAQPAFVGVARSVIATVATAIEGIGDERLEDLRLAVSEACTNAVEAGTDKRIILRAVQEDGHLEVLIEDSGRALGSEGMAANGFGLQLLTALVDDVEFVDRGDAGSAVRLRMALSDT